MGFIYNDHVEKIGKALTSNTNHHLRVTGDKKGRHKSQGDIGFLFSILVITSANGPKSFVIVWSIVFDLLSIILFYLTAFQAPNNLEEAVYHFPVRWPLLTTCVFSHSLLLQSCDWLRSVDSNVAFYLLLHNGIFSVSSSLLDYLQNLFQHCIFAIILQEIGKILKT